MSLSDEYKNLATELLIEKSNRNMQQAIVNAENNFWDLVANRLYYSIFHAVSALLMREGINTSSHKGTSSQFGKYFVLTGKYSREDGTLYGKLQAMREKADYDNVFNLSEKEGRELIDSALELQRKLIQDLKIIKEQA